MDNTVCTVIMKTKQIDEMCTTITAQERKHPLWYESELVALNKKSKLKQKWNPEIAKGVCVKLAKQAHVIPPTMINIWLRS